jgi:hypothetical protein
MPILLTPRRRSNQPAFDDARQKLAQPVRDLPRRHIDQAA